jgi:hypothetical protein
LTRIDLVRIAKKGQDAAAPPSGVAWWHRAGARSGSIRSIGAPTGGSGRPRRDAWPDGRGSSMKLGRLVSMGFALAAALGHASCATLAPQTVAANPLVVPSADFETVWKATIAVVDDYFEIASENRLARTIVTQPKVGATLLEPWNGDSVGFGERLESTLQSMRRFARVTINPAPNGGYTVEVKVFKQLEDLVKPDRQAAGRAVFNNDFPVNRAREIVGPVPMPVGWIDRNRDPKLEQVILKRIRDALFL